MSRIVFRYEETKIDNLNREMMCDSKEHAVYSGPGQVPLEEIMNSFAYFLKGCGYDIENITVNKVKNNFINLEQNNNNLIKY